MAKISLPNEWVVREYQAPLWDYMVKDQGLRAVAVWHRRAGKDATALNITSVKMWERPGMYLHMLPNQTQARKVIWDARDFDGKRLIDQAFPPPLREGNINNTEMKILFRPVGGGRSSLWQLAGSDNIDAWMGSNPVGVVMSEFDLTNPYAWDYLRPILTMNGGWALFIFTFRGKRHGYALFQAAQKNESWFAQKLTVDDTMDEIDRDRADKGLPGTLLDAIEDDRASGMSEELIRQEYWCDPDVPMPGAIFSIEYTKAVDDGRISDEYGPIQGVPVDTAWDIGVGHKTAIWFFQRGPMIRIVKYFESAGHDVEWYADKLEEFKQHYGWEYGQHWGPHDLRNKDWSSKYTRIQVAKARGIAFRIVFEGNPLAIEDQHQAVRSLFPRFCFYEPDCRNLGKEGGDGLASVASYQYEEDEDKSTPTQKFFKKKPLDNWATDGAAALRYLSVAFRDHIEQARPVEPRWNRTFDETVKMMERRARHG